MVETSVRWYLHRGIESFQGLFGDAGFRNHPQYHGRWKVGNFKTSPYKQ